LPQVPQSTRSGATSRMLIDFLRRLRDLDDLYLGTAMYSLAVNPQVVPVKIPYGCPLVKVRRGTSAGQKRPTAVQTTAAGCCPARPKPCRIHVFESDAQPSARTLRGIAPAVRVVARTRSTPCCGDHLDQLKAHPPSARGLTIRGTSDRTLDL
jgi:hypothetical protein